LAGSMGFFDHLLETFVHLNMSLCNEIIPHRYRT